MVKSERPGFASRAPLEVFGLLIILRGRDGGAGRGDLFFVLIVFGCVFTTGEEEQAKRAKRGRQTRDVHPSAITALCHWRAAFEMAKRWRCPNPFLSSIWSGSVCVHLSEDAWAEKNIHSVQDWDTWIDTCHMQSHVIRIW